MEHYESIIKDVNVFRRRAGNWGEFQISTNRKTDTIRHRQAHHHITDHVEIGHLTKFGALKLNRDQVMTLEPLETWLKIKRL